MSADLALTGDDLTIEFEGSDDRADLTADEAEAVTGRIRRWVNEFPIEDVVLAFRGRVWVALAYDSWAEWCECELDGLKLPAPKRREVVVELAGAGMSNRAIADTIGVGHQTIGRDLSTGPCGPVDKDRKSLGQDGRERSHPRPKADATKPEQVVAEIVCRDCDGFGCETCFPEDPSVTPSVEDFAAEQIANIESGQTTWPEAIGATRDAIANPKKPAAPQKDPRRKPITEAFTLAAMDLTKVTNRITSLSKDDRFERNTDQIALRISDLVRARDALQCVIDKFHL